MLFLAGGLYCTTALTKSNKALLITAEVHVHLSYLAMPADSVSVTLQFFCAKHLAVVARSGGGLSIY